MSAKQKYMHHGDLVSYANIERKKKNVSLLFSAQFVLGKQKIFFLIVGNFAEAGQFWLDGRHIRCIKHR